MRDYPAELLRQYLEEGVSEKLITYHWKKPMKQVSVDMLYYIERVTDFVRRHYGYEQQTRTDSPA